MARALFHTILKRSNWSALSAVGNSNISRLTVLMPFIGYLLLFNSDLQFYLRITLPNETQTSNLSLWYVLYEDKLSFLYLGLLLFGLGIGIFGIFCPRKIRERPSVANYIAFMEGIKTNNLVKNSLDSISHEYFSTCEGEERSASFNSDKPAFPSEVSAGLHQLMEDCYYDEENTIEGLDEERDENGYSLLFPGTMGLDTGQLLEIMYTGNSATRAVYTSFHEIAFGRSLEVFYLEHLMLDHSLPLGRFIVLALLSFGVFLMFIPTIATTVLVLSNLF